ncbi:MAG: hypothetical protein HYU66_16890 [Armatimonadetes bacterium]|nr:hypothetical protein [Armatimonadota bacterium]
MSMSNQAAQVERETPASIAARSLLRHSRLVAASRSYPPAVRALAGALEEAARVYGQVVEDILAAPHEQVVELVHRRRADLDYYLFSSPNRFLAELAQTAVDADPRLTTVVPLIVEELERKRQDAVSRLLERGVERLAISAGWPFGPGHVEPSGEEPVPTDNPEWDGRVAEVRPGHGGWKVHGEVVIPAVARAYKYVAA